MSERRNYSNNRNPRNRNSRDGNPRNRQGNRNGSKRDSNKKEFVIQVINEEDYNKREELISGHIFDAMFAIQDGIDQIYIRSQGRAINTCAILTLKLEERFKDQYISYRKKINVNSKFLGQKYNKAQKGKNPKKTEFNPNRPNILSYLDVKIFIKK